MTDFKWFAERRITAIKNIHACLFSWLNSVLFIVPTQSANGAWLMDTKPKLLKQYSDLWKSAGEVTDFASAVDWFVHEQTTFQLTYRCVRVLSHPMYAANIRAGLSTAHATKQEIGWQKVIDVVEFYHRMPVKKWYTLCIGLSGFNIQLLSNAPTTGFALWCFRTLQDKQPVANIIEQNKDHQLGTVIMPTVECLGTRGLVSVALDMDVGVVLGLSSDTTAGLVSELCKIYNVTFWPLPMFTNEYSLKAYVSAEFISEHELDVGLHSGLNNRFIKRYKIIRLSGDTLSYPVTPHDPSKQNITLQCVGSHIRLMGVASDWAAKGRPVLSGRASAYNDKIVACVLERGIQPAHRALINTYEAAMAAPKMAAGVRGEFVESMMSAAELMLSELTHSALYNVFTSANAIDTFSRILRDRLHVYKTIHGGVEHAVTWLINTDLMMAKFRREYNVVCYELFSSKLLVDNDMTHVSRKKLILQAVRSMFESVSVVLDTKPASLEEFEANLKMTALTTDL